MTIGEIKKVLEQKCTHIEENVYIYDNVEFLIKNEGGYSMVIRAKGIEVKPNAMSYGLLDDYLVFYSDERNFTISLKSIEDLNYVEWDKPKEEEPITMEQTLDKFYEELIKPFIVKVAKDIYKEIKNDKS